MTTSAAAVAAITDFEAVPSASGSGSARERRRSLRPVPQPEIFAIDRRPVVRSGLARLAHRALGCGAQTLGSIELAYAAAQLLEAPPRALLIGVGADDDPPLLVGRARELGAPVILVVDPGDPALIRAVIAAHADGYVLADEADAGSLRATVMTAERGDAVIPDRLRAQADQTQAAATITARCLQVLGGLSDGLHDHEIARSLGISTSAVRKHITAAQERLEARTRTQVVAIAARNGLL
jgi:DNA-binding NarL/FixJ family response regulator